MMGAMGNNQAELHIEGMGWLGAVTARVLAERSSSFGWHDTDAPYTAWKASTGIANASSKLSN